MTFPNIETWRKETFGELEPWRETLDEVLECYEVFGEQRLIMYLNDLAPTLRRRDIPRDDGKPYMTRYAIHGWMPEDGEAVKYSRSIYLHRFHAPDFDDAPHSHPWEWARSFVLTGGYIERRFDTTNGDVKYTQLGPGNLSRIDPSTFHVIERLVGQETWTLFSTGPKTGKWGFWDAERGYIDWRARLKERGLQPEY